jgi:hypothetical protein
MRLHHLTAIFLATAAASWQAAWAADLIVSDPGTVVQDTQLPAVSGLNGKWEFDPGVLYGSGGVRGAGSITVPIGDQFGVQGDVQASYSGHGLVYGGALHAFTRDPSSYLVGVTGGFVSTPNARLGAVGPEAELYLDRFSLEGWAGIAGLDFVDPNLVDKIGGFAIGDAAYYPTDDFRLSLGGSYVLGDLSLHGGAEYQFTGFGVPLSITGDARLHNNGSATFTVGLKGYFGGDDSKSLINRHRQDDPPNRAIDLFAGAGSQLFQTSSASPGSGTPSIDYESACEDDAGGTWINDSTVDGECNFGGDVNDPSYPFTAPA